MKCKIVIAVLLSIFSLTTYADIDVCDSRDIHCSYIINGATPKYIKVDRSVNGHYDKSYWVCVDDKTALTIDQWQIDYGFYIAGNELTFKYTQCDDKDCKHGINVGYESFIIKKTFDDDYYSTPQTYSIRLRNNFGKSCTPRSGEFKQIKAFHVR